MDPDSIARYITGTFAGVDVVHASGDVFFFFDPGDALPQDRRMPFATLVTGDRYDCFSNLDRPAVFRLNVGVGKETFQALFEIPATASPEASDSALGNSDFTALDAIMPHPVFGRMFWICVLNPSAATFQKVEPLLAEAYERSARKHGRMRPTAAP